MHRLCLIAAPEDPQARGIFERLEVWKKGSGAQLNIELTRIAPDDPHVDWNKQCGIPSAPPSAPVVVLAGRQQAKGLTFFIDYWQPAPSADDLKTLLTSPAREAIRREVVRCVAVLLYVRGTDADAGRAEPLIEATRRAWRDRGPFGVSIVRVDRTDVREKVLLSFTGVKPEGPDWIAVVFGRGKFMPPLVGRDITEAELTRMVEAVAAECTCLQTAAGMGVDIPMAWSKSDDERVAFMAQPSDEGDAKAEETADAEADAVAIDMPDVKLAAPRIDSPVGSSASGRVMKSLLWVLVPLVVFTGIATVAIVSRKNRRGTNTAPTSEG